MNDKDNFDNFDEDDFEDFLNSQNKRDIRDEFFKHVSKQDNEDNFRDIMNILLSMGRDMFDNSELQDDDGWSSEHWESEDGRYHVSSFTRDLDFGGFNEDETGELPIGRLIHHLEDRLSQAVEEEDYEEAATLRDSISSLKKGEENKKK